MDYKIGDVLELTDGRLAYVMGVSGSGDEKYTVYNVDNPSEIFKIGEDKIKGLLPE